VAHCEEGKPRTQRPELAEILNAYTPQLNDLSPDQARVVSALGACRTAALGGHLQKCDRCGREQPVYNSCRNRHCPKCQSLEQALWVEAQAEDLLPVPYFHLVFTLPHVLNPIFLREPRLSYGLLFEASAATLVDVCRRRLGATPGITAVLHTWTQLLLYHPHIHCIASGGGLSANGEWISSRPDFFLPVRVLANVFRGKLLETFEATLTAGHLRISERAVRDLLRRAAAKDFVVYSKAPFAGPEQVLRYLGRYTHRIAIGNERLRAHCRGSVSFSYRDRKHGGRRKRIRLPGSEFTRRFLLHVVPRRFVRVRHYGLLANGVKRSRLTLARSQLNSRVAPRPSPAKAETWQDTYRRLLGRDPRQCPQCHAGRLVVVAVIPPSSTPASSAASSRAP
jgi:putative transposase/transposase-like zinc-binding protein